MILLDHISNLTNKYIKHVEWIIQRLSTMLAHVFLFKLSYSTENKTSVSYDVFCELLYFDYELTEKESCFYESV